MTVDTSGVRPTIAEAVEQELLTETLRIISEAYDIPVKYIDVSAARAEFARTMDRLDALA